MKMKRNRSSRLMSVTPRLNLAIPAASAHSRTFISHAKDLVKAEAAYRKAIELDPTDTDAYISPRALSGH